MRILDDRDHEAPAYEGKEEIEAGNCSIHRFIGQTVVRVPAGIAERIGQSELVRLCEEAFESKSLELYAICYLKDHAEICLPSVFNPNPEEVRQALLDLNPEKVHPDYHKPDELVKAIMSYREL